MVTFTYCDITCMALNELFKFPGEIPVCFFHIAMNIAVKIIFNIVQP